VKVVVKVHPHVNPTLHLSAERKQVKVSEAWIWSFCVYFQRASPWLVPMTANSLRRRAGFSTMWMSCWLVLWNSVGWGMRRTGRKTSRTRLRINYILPEPPSLSTWPKKSWESSAFRTPNPNLVKTYMFSRTELKEQLQLLFTGLKILLEFLKAAGADGGCDFTINLR